MCKKHRRKSLRVLCVFASKMKFMLSHFLSQTKISAKYSKFVEKNTDKRTSQIRGNTPKLKTLSASSTEGFFCYKTTPSSSFIFNQHSTLHSTLNVF